MLFIKNSINQSPDKDFLMKMYQDLIERNILGKYYFDISKTIYNIFKIFPNINFRFQLLFSMNNSKFISKYYLKNISL